jgi:hypothetical protein
MRAQWSFGLLAAAVVGYCAVGPVQAVAPIGGKGWLLDQRSCTAGAIEVIVCDKAIKWHCPKLGLTFVSLAPKWEVIAYNEKNKKYMELSQDELLQILGQSEKTRKDAAKFGTIDRKTQEQMYQRLPGHTKICGLTTIEYRIPKEYSKIGKDVSSKNIDPFVKKDLEAANKRISKVYSAKRWQPGDENCWVAADITLPEIVRKLGWHGNSAHPFLRSIHVGDGGTSAMALDTIACKQVPISFSVFEIPKNFEKTKSQMQLVTGMQDDDIDIFAGAPSSNKTPPAASAQKPGSSAALKPSPALPQKPASVAKQK